MVVEEEEEAALAAVRAAKMAPAEKEEMQAEKAAVPALTVMPAQAEKVAVCPVGASAECGMEGSTRLASCLAAEGRAVGAA